MTQNRLCSDSLPAQAIHNGFSNTTGLIMVQLVKLKYERKRKRPNEGNAATHRGKEKQEKRERKMTRDREKNHVEKPNRKQDGLVERKKEWKKRKRKRTKKQRKKERNPHDHIQYAIQKSHNTAGQQLWPWWFWQKWFTMVTVGLQPSEHPRTPHRSPTFLTASPPIWLDAQLKCHASATHTHRINQTETVEWKNRARRTSQNEINQRQK